MTLDQTSGSQTPGPPLDMEEAAYLAGHDRGLLDAATVDLIERGVLLVGSAESGCLLSVSPEIPKPALPWGSARQVIVNALRETLRERHPVRWPLLSWIAEPAEAIRLKLRSQGLLHSWPFTWLTIAPHRTHLGNLTLRTLKTQYGQLLGSSRATVPPSLSSSQELPPANWGLSAGLVLVLFGAAALSRWPVPPGVSQPLPNPYGDVSNEFWTTLVEDIPDDSDHDLDDRYAGENTTDDDSSSSGDDGGSGSD